MELLRPPAGRGGATDTSQYFPLAGDTPDTTDVGKMLRAMVTYTTGAGDDVQPGTAVGVSEFPVRAAPTGPTNRPSLDVVPDVIDGLREDTPLGMHVGGRVSATDDDDDDVGKLTYTLMPSAVMADPDDVGYFEINKATGRITVAQPLDFDPIPGNDGPEYTMRVRVTDPNGDTDELPLTINVIDANDSPVATGAAELRVNEMMDDGDYTGAPGLLVKMPGTPTPDLALYTATDDDEIHVISWDLEGVDARLFLITDTEITALNSVRLQFRLEPESDFGPPNYEEPNDANGDNVYKVIVVATDGDGGRHERPVTVFVDNVYEPGKLELSTEEPLVDEKD